MSFLAFFWLCCSLYLRLLGGIQQQKEDKITNNLLSMRYGVFCGPGPSDKLLQSLSPVDHVDSMCKQHDLAYRSCHMQLNKALGFDAPSYINQVMPLRGVLPMLIVNALLKTFGESYFSCMHRADATLANQFRGLLSASTATTIRNNSTSSGNVRGRLPMWWQDTKFAPSNAEGKYSKKACSFGFPLFGLCLLKTQDLFVHATRMFELAVEADVKRTTSDLDASLRREPGFPLASTRS